MRVLGATFLFVCFLWIFFCAEADDHETDRAAAD